MHWRRWLPSILAWSQRGQASLAARPNQWRYTPKRSCPVVRGKQATASVLFTCLAIEPTVARGSPWLSKALGLMG
ncbi:uncharacterized protein TNCV_4510951 [Trichonephila clavipes]|nr:uncharacterized protein TNCV_4510951 [Trichonephila clavipes]